MNSETYLDKWSKYSKNIKWEDYTPRDYRDLRKRVRSETIRGRFGILNESIEEYCVRQVKGHTATRIGIIFTLGFCATIKSKSYLLY